MKKSKSELILEAWLSFLNYLDKHKNQGRLLFGGISISLILLSIKSTTNEIVTIIKALK